METKTILPAMHLMVDALCACSMCLLATQYGTANILTLYVLYNVAAFLTQPLSGHVADRMRSDRFAVSFCLMLAIYVFAMAWGLKGSHDGDSIQLQCMAVLLGLGNSCFHVWAGRHTALRTDNDIRWLGVFVSTGAVGLSVGTVFSSWVLAWGLLIAIIIFALLYLQYERDLPLVRNDNVTPLHEMLNRSLAGNRHANVKTGMAIICVLVVALMALVSVRSLVGGMLSQPLHKAQSLVLTAGMVTMCGKIAGGWIARAIGLTTTLFLAAAVTALCAVFCRDNMLAATVGLFAINCTMPLTLYLINVAMQGKEGLAFGLLAASLMPAYLLAA